MRVCAWSPPRAPRPFRAGAERAFAPQVAQYAITYRGVTTLRRFSDFEGDPLTRAPGGAARV